MAIRAPDGANKEKAAGGSWQQGNQFSGGTNSVGAVSAMCEHDSLRQLRIRENCILFCCIYCICFCHFIQIMLPTHERNLSCIEILWLASKSSLKKNNSLSHILTASYFNNIPLFEEH